MPSTTPSTYTNPSAKTWSCPSLTDPRILPFHRTLPSYNRTPLTPLPTIAQELGLKAVYLKDESLRFGLPAFKILGASWAVYRAVAQAVGVDIDTVSGLGAVRDKAEGSGISIVTTTEGNWGRAVARMCRYLGVPVKVNVPRYMDFATQTKIHNEGAKVVVIAGEYDDALRVSESEARESGALLVLDTSWDGYEEIPRWVTEGYSTMLAEVDAQLEGEGCGRATVAIASVGVGSWAHSVVAHYKAQDAGVSVVTVEPSAAACLNAALKAGKIVSVETGDTIMNGMNCGTVSRIAWPYLRDGVDASVVIGDGEAHEAVEELRGCGVRPGPCGAAPLVALRKVVREGAIQLGREDVVVLYCTEGKREYVVPQ